MSCRHGLGHAWENGEAMISQETAKKMQAALAELFEHCAMIHTHWGDGDNSKEADAAITAAHNALDDAERDERPEGVKEAEARAHETNADGHDSDSADQT
jgi:hypothetical protein